jgi:peroxiredoxin
LVVLAVNVGESPSEVKDFVVWMGVSLPVLLDSRNEVARLYQVGAFPTNFLIDRQGIIQEVRIGAFRDAADVAASLRQIIE